MSFLKSLDKIQVGKTSQIELIFILNIIYM